ncbi:hypothetical protein HDA32_002870 [Spinactinospora alkalitolerans]|uniref:DUF4185 domain-containing protein n=1 Tax=Spinactinospora alkalitolerans TaxID=687207 RepID=A0A852U176_9ACTN|nr:DUF4185 domain-containing protein [Spinactinospora alkalitolerans]NYE47750.1 hypothetical protein [Spinactinospora alkalitolerans]
MRVSDDGNPRPAAAAPPSGRAGPSMNRSAFLRTAAGAVVGSGLLAGAPMGGAAAAQTRTPGAAASQALEVTKIADLTGPGLTTRFRMEATDLGVPAVTPDGRMLFVFGDTFEEARVGGGWWRSPVALYSTTTDLDGGVRWSGAVGGDAAQQLWPYEHDNPVFSTVLPSDVITIGGTMYLHAMVNQGLGNVVWTEIWRSDDSGATWVHTGAKFPSDLHGGLFQLLTWGLGNDGYVYVYSTEFTRSKPIILHRVRSERIADPAAYEPWGYRDGTWAWGNPPTPILDGAFGELCLRPLDGKWMLTWFNAGDYRIDGIVVDTPTSNLHTAYRRTLIWGGEWGAEDDSHVAQLYGGYIIPGSTLDDLHLSVSQWNTDNDWPYRVMQHRIRGFGA